ncbi:MAG: dihydroneopterin aldolase [Verrucomicrobiota bacterium]
MNKIIINELEVFYHVGVPDEERAQPQRLLITVEMEHHFSAGVQSDDLKGTIDYFAVAQSLLKLGEGRSWKLIEKLASDIADVVLRDFHAVAVSVEVKKFIIPQARHVAVKIRRTLVAQ